MHRFKNRNKNKFIMKKIFAGIALMGTFAIASAQTITFKETTIDYGTIKTNADGNKVFTVKNTGDKPLIISKVQPQCGCTTPEWSQEPIMPGKTGKIKVHYNTALTGNFQKLIEVYSNDPANSRSVIFIKGNVDPNAPESATKEAAEDVKEAAKSVGNAVSTTAKKGVKATKKTAKKIGNAFKN